MLYSLLHPWLMDCQVESMAFYYQSSQRERGECLLGQS